MSAIKDQSNSEVVDLTVEESFEKSIIRLRRQIKDCDMQHKRNLAPLRMEIMQLHHKIKKRDRDNGTTALRLKQAEEDKALLSSCLKLRIKSQDKFIVT